ncbi:MAG: penicillin-binding protein 1C [Nannocystaceae bacterium]|nr:penicillin-binding protein 1C [Nannocystaceae bacterium]
MTRRRRRLLLALAAIVVAGAWLAWRGFWQRLREQAGAPQAELDDRWFDGQRVLDRNGALLRELPSDHGRRGRPLDRDAIGERLIQATLSSEDRAFFEHDGIDRAALARALEQNLRHGRLVSGASTITQQLVKLLDTRGVPGDRDLELKLREAARAQNLEQVLDKDTILLEYLNRLPYGRGLVGPEAAAQGWFGVAARDLSWAQAALLAVLPRAPSALDPMLHRDRAVMRQRALLQQLHDDGVIDGDALARALAEPLQLRTPSHPFEAPHFVEMLRAEGRLRAHGETRTTLDLRLQHDVEGLVRTHLVTVGDREVGNAAVVVVDNATGDVLAYVGSADHDALAIDGQVDMVRALRQPGSTLKPFVVAAAMAQGHTPTELVADVPTAFVEGSGNTWAPGNFDGGHVGPIALREALAASLNVPLVRLAQALGPTRLLADLHALGFASLDRDADHYGLSIALGTGEVELRELAAAYVALARGGEAIELRVDHDALPATPRRVIDPGVAAAVTDALSDPLARVRLLHGRSPFDIGFALAVKTGTSSGFRDAWTVGYTRERTVAVWIGNADGSPTKQVSGAGGAGPLFADVMRRAMLDVPTREPLLPPGALEHVEVCALSGDRPGAQCPDRVVRRFVPGATPARACDVHVLARNVGNGSDGRARWRCDEHGDPVVRLPEAFDAWLRELPDGAPGRDAAGLPWLAHAAVAGCDAASSGPATLTIAAPTEGMVLPRAAAGVDDRVELIARPSAGLELDAVAFVLDGKVIAEATAPFVARVAVPPGDHELYARPVERDRAVVGPRVHFSVR